MVSNITVADDDDDDDDNNDNDNDQQTPIQENQSASVWSCLCPLAENSHLHTHSFPMYHRNDSMYTLHTVNDDDDDRVPLRTHTQTSYGTTTPPSSKKLIFNATLKMACIFFISTLLLGGTLWLALPTLDECV